MLSLIHIPDRGTCDEIRLQLIFVEDRTKNGMKSLASRRSGVKHLQLHIHLKEETKLSLSFGSILPRSQILILQSFFVLFILALLAILTTLRFMASDSVYRPLASCSQQAFGTLHSQLSGLSFDWWHWMG